MDDDLESQNMEALPPRPEQQELFPLVKKQLELEGQRIDSANRRTEVADKAIQATDASDQRQFNYYMTVEENRSKASERTHCIVTKVINFGGCFPAIGSGGIGACVLWQCRSNRFSPRHH